MLQLRARAEVLAIPPRVEFHGDERRKAITVKLRFKSVPLAVIEEGFVSQLSLFYGAAEESQYPDVETLVISREVEHVRADIGGVVLSDMRVDGVRMRLLAKRTAELTLKLKGLIEDGMDELHDRLLDTVDVELTEREAIEEGEQRAA